MANRIVVTKALTVAADADGIAQSQTPLAAGNLTINGALATGGVANLTSQRRVLFTFAADDSARIFTIYGTNSGGNPISEAVAGTATTAVSLLDYLTVTRIAVDAATAGALTVGTNGVGSSQFFNVNYHNNPISLAIGCVVSGTINYDIEYTYNDFWTTPAYGVTYTPPTVWDDPIITAATASADTVINNPVTGWRVTINSGSGSVTATGIEAGFVGN